MKGQYTIIVELLLVLIGIFITGFVISTFNTVQASVTNVSVDDSFNAVANDITIGVLKASLNNNSLVRVSVPNKISDHVYKIRLGTNEISVTSLKDSGISIRREIFNISLVNRIITSEAASALGAVEIVNDANGIKIRRPPSVL